MKKLLIIQVAALGSDFAKSNDMLEVAGIKMLGGEGIFPALTCSVQAGFRTGLNVSGHGMPGNGYLDRTMMRSYFWEQSAAIVGGGRIWDGFAAAGGKVAMLFWQQSLGESAQCIVSPAPVHKHHGGIIENTYSKPGDLYSRLHAEVGRDFKLRDYWGPLASVKASQWIADATTAMISDSGMCPDLCFTYLPALDYDLQRYGPESGKAVAAAQALRSQLEQVVTAAKGQGMEVVIFGDYAIAPVDGAVFPNRYLADEGLLKLNRIKGMQYPDLYESRAFCVVDHEVGHVYVKAGSDLEQVRNVLACAPGVDSVLGRAEQESMGIACARSGDLVVVASDGKWLAYPWWTDKRAAPEYAGHVDIHSKPGYDPCELFFGWPPGSTGLDTDRIRGSHGRTGAGRDVAWGSTIEFGQDSSDLLELSRGIGRWLDEGGE